jgi:hypothetical protein
MMYTDKRERSFDVSFNLAQVNALTLHPKKEDEELGLVCIGRVADLAEQFDDVLADVVCTQEATGQSAQSAVGKHKVYASDATARGTHGCQICIHMEAFFQRFRVAFDEKMVQPCQQDPTRLIVNVDVPGFPTTVSSLHAPHHEYTMSAATRQR